MRANITSMGMPSAAETCQMSIVPCVSLRQVRGFETAALIIKLELYGAIIVLWSTQTRVSLGRMINRICFMLGQIKMQVTLRLLMPRQESCWENWLSKLRARRCTRVGGWGSEKGGQSMDWLSAAETLLEVTASSVLMMKWGDSQIDKI